jgi:hypothetical protein
MKIIINFLRNRLPLLHICIDCGAPDTIIGFEVGNHHWCVPF